MMKMVSIQKFNQLDISEVLKEMKQQQWQEQILEDKKKIANYIINTDTQKTNLTQGLSYEEVAFFLRAKAVFHSAPKTDIESITFTKFVLNLYESFASQDNFFLERIFCPKPKKKIIFPEVNSTSDAIRMTYDIDSISFTGYFFPFKAQSITPLPLKICLSPSQYRNLTKDTCIRMLDPITNDMKSLPYFKHTLLMDVYGFAGYIFFPRLQIDQRKWSNYNNMMINDDYHFFIEEILLPCIQRLKPDGTFPDNVKCKNQFKGNNRNSFNAIQLPVELFHKVVQEMRKTISLQEDEKMEQFKDFFFHFQSIGVKNIYKGEKKHTIDKLINFLENFVNVDCDVKAYYDIGIEFYYENLEEKYTLFWSQDGAEALHNGLDLRGSVTRTGTMYSNDLLGIFTPIIICRNGHQKS